MLFTVAALHVPFMPFADTDGSVGTVPPSQIFREVPKLNVGVLFE
jgi:hypothetical protein